VKGGRILNFNQNGRRKETKCPFNLEFFVAYHGQDSIAIG
jgi:hypothetical protein